MSKHTPGPWMINYNGTHGHIKSVWPDHAHGRTPTLAMFGNQHRAMSISEDEAIANATLMAAAPDLLEACKAFIALFRDSDMRPEDECHELYGVMTEAIAKATEKPNP